MGINAQRDPQAVLRDVRNELLSPAKAAAEYGVIVDTSRWVVDEAASKQARTEIARRRGWQRPPKVQRHDPLPVAKAVE